MSEKDRSLEESLSRMNDALARPDAASPAAAPAGPLSTLETPRTRGLGSASPVLAVLAVALFVAAVRTHDPLLWVLALGTAAGGGALFLKTVLSAVFGALQGGPPSSTQASIGLGATIAEGAVVEPGAMVEMGATLERGAVVRAGAVVRMGATVESDAVVESGAVVSWGAVVSRGATVGQRAVVGAGSVVGRGVRLQPGMRLNPGTTWAAGATALPAADAAPTRPAVRDLRDDRVAAVCDKLEAELRASPGTVRAFLGGSDLTISSLRRTCEDLSRRERAMREEADPPAVARLNEERAALEKRIAGEHDAQLRQSLQGAIAAVDELKRQRELLRVGAERLQAEHTRLVYTLEGLASQLVRLRTAGATAAPVELSQGVLDLRARIDAIADALEEFSRDAPAAMRELATGPAEASAEPAPGRVRSRLPGRKS